MKTLLILCEVDTDGPLCAELIDHETGEADAVTGWVVEARWFDPFGRPFGFEATFFAGDKKLLTVPRGDVAVESITYLD